MKSKSHSRIIALFLAVITVFASAIPAMAAENSTGSKGTDIAVLDGVLKTTGTDLDKILPPVSRFSKGGSDRTKIK